MRKFVLFVATGAGSGYAPIAPGTAGSVVGVFLYISIAWALGASVAILALGTLLLAAAGVWAAGRAETFLGRKDDGRITIDEVSGMWLSLLFLPLRADVLVAGFFLFRLFDIWKPPPARAAEGLGGGLGVMADDWVAGLYANVVGQVLWWLLPGGLL